MEVREYLHIEFEKDRRMNKKTLEDLSKVDWEHLRAIEVPEMLRGLGSNLSDVRLQAYESLFERLIQPDMFEGYGTLRDVIKNELQTIVAGFLRKLLENPNTENKEYALRLLSGFCFFFTFEEAMEPYAIRLTNLKQEIFNGIQLYLSLIEDSEQVVRQAAIILGERISEHSSLYVERLLPRIHDEASPDLRMLSIWKIFSKLDNDVDLKRKFEATYIRLLNDRVENESSDNVRIVAAVCLANIQMENTQPAAIALIERGLKSIQSNDILLGIDWGYDRYRLTHALTLVEKQQGKEALKRVLNSGDILAVNVFYALNGLLYLEFGSGDLPDWYLYEDTYHRFVGWKLPEDISKPPVISKLNVTQAELVRDLLQVSRIFDVHTNIFEIYGLPNTHKLLTQLVS